MALITPDNDVVDIFNDFWTDNPTTNEIILFEGGDSVDVRTITQEFKGLNAQDDEIRNTEDLYVFLSEINSKYHTRVRNGVGDIVEELAAQGITTKQILIDQVIAGQLTIPAFVGICKNATETYTYSFATKVFSFIDDRFPIVDSFAVTVLDAYEYEGKINKKFWGNYEQYRNNYTIFKNVFHIERTNRETDRFLWTYGKTLEAYWKLQGVLSFSTVSFDPDTITN